MKKFIFTLALMLFIPFINVNASTTINSVTVNVELPVVGDTVLPEGYTGTDIDNIVDDGHMNPDSFPVISTTTEGVVIDSSYYIKSLNDSDELFFGRFKKGENAYAVVNIEAESTEYVLADNVQINVNYTKGTINYSKNPEHQGTIHIKSGYNISYTDFTFSMPTLNRFRVNFESNGGTNVDSQTLTGSGVTESAQIQRPEDPTRDGYEFRGWFENEDLSGEEFDFNVSVSEPLTLYAKWEDMTEEYTVTEGDAIATFRYDKGFNFDLSFVDILSLTPEEVEVLSEGTVTPEMFNEMLDVIKNSVKGYGTFLGFYAIEIQDTHVVPNRGYGGQVKFKVKMTDEMKKYDTFKFIYLDEENNFKVGDIADFKIEGDYIVGTLPHLSAYVLVGNVTETPAETKKTAPKTGDNILLYISLLGLSILCIYNKKKIMQ